MKENKVNDNRMNFIGIAILIICFILFYVLTTYFLDKRVVSNPVDNETHTEVVVDDNKENEKAIVNNLYNDVRIIYDVVNTMFKVSQEEIITDEDIIYKKVINFNEIMDNLFTINGKNDYLLTFADYFVKEGEDVYLAGNLVNYQTYFFRGDDTGVYIIDSNSDNIKAIIYEKWTSNNTNTLALMEIVKENNKWLVDNVDILSTK